MNISKIKKPTLLACSREIFEDAQQRKNLLDFFQYFVILCNEKSDVYPGQLKTYGCK